MATDSPAPDVNPEPNTHDTPVIAAEIPDGYRFVPGRAVDLAEQLVQEAGDAAAAIIARPGYGFLVPTGGEKTEPKTKPTKSTAPAPAAE